jgi:2-oxoglutarate ferredoxin oxidoreductase subunit gamma
VERELLITGIGGQGVQLAAQVVARAATLEGRSVSFLGLYGGMMRGGSTDSTIIVADGPIESPPIVSRAWSAIAMHHEFWDPIAAKLAPGALVLVNDATFALTAPPHTTFHRIPATETAASLDNPLGGSMVMIAAYCTMTGLVTVDALVEAMRASIPPYRTQHIARNEASLRAGAGLVDAGSHPAWNATAAVAS